MSTVALASDAPDRRGWSALPFVVCYVLIPAPMILTQIAGLPPLRIAFDVALAGVAGIAILAIAASGRVRLFDSADIAVLLGALALSMFAARVVGAYTTGEIDLTFVALEIKPLFYVVIALLLLMAFGPPKPDVFVHYGSWLGMLLVADCVVRSAVAGVLTRAVGTAEVNYDAALLVLSLCFALDQQKRWRWHILMIFMGLLASMSRTGLAAALLIVLLSSRLSIPTKVSMLVFGLGSAVFSFAFRGQSLDNLSTLDRVWMWMVGIDVLANHPVELLFGFPIGQPLPVGRIPDPIKWIWIDLLGQSGGAILPLHFHAFWLRSIMTWGLITTLAATAALLLPVYRRDRTLAFRLTLLLLVEGMTMGLFYLSNVAVPLLLSFSTAAIAVVRRRVVPQSNIAGLAGPQAP